RVLRLAFRSPDAPQCVTCSKRLADHPDRAPKVGTSQPELAPPGQRRPPPHMVGPWTDTACSDRQLPPDPRLGVEQCVQLLGDHVLAPELVLERSHLTDIESVGQLLSLAQEPQAGRERRDASIRAGELQCARPPRFLHTSECSPQIL